jgi:hypothetical protein
MGELFMKMVPGYPEYGHPVFGAVAKTYSIWCSESSTTIGRV